MRGCISFWWQCFKWTLPKIEKGEGISAVIMPIVFAFLAMGSIGGVVGAIISQIWWLLLLIPFGILMVFVAPFSIYTKTKSELEELREKNISKLDYRLISFPQSGTRILNQGEDERQRGYAQIAIINKGSTVNDCIGIMHGFAVVGALGDKNAVCPLTFTNERLSWHGGECQITIPSDGVERYLNLAHIDQFNPGYWQLAISGDQKKEYLRGWWKIDVTITSLSTQMEPLKIEVALGLGDREQPASGLNLRPWHKWYESRAKQVQQASDTPG